MRLRTSSGITTWNLGETVTVFISIILSYDASGVDRCGPVALLEKNRRAASNVEQQMLALPRRDHLHELVVLDLLHLG
ncbi:MAG: hypothetical protein ABIO45_01730, partial [Burkholderiaceae bacterium]